MIKRNDRQGETDSKERQQGKEKKSFVSSKPQSRRSDGYCEVSLLRGLEAGFEAALAALSTV
jgi:hypothetical protein